MAKKLKKTKKAVLSRLYYQKRKLKEITKEYNKYKSRRKNVKVNIDGRKVSEKTAADIVLNKSKLVNNKISELENKVKTYKSKSGKKRTYKEIRASKEKSYFLLEAKYPVWEYKKLNEVVDDKKVKTVNGISKKTSYPDIQMLMDKMSLNMDSSDVIVVLYNKSLGAIKLEISSGSIKRKSKNK